MSRLSFLATTAAALIAGTASAQDVRITEDMPGAFINVNGQVLNINRIQDQEHRLDSEFTKTSRACPPFCIHAMSAGDGVETVGELEVIAFLEEFVAEGKGLLIDSRIPAWYEKGAIPGAINIPFSTVEETNPYRDDILQALGAKKDGESWDFENATDLLLYCNGPWCDQSPRAIQNLLQAGYPPEKLRYYRGGMQNWLMMGLTTTAPANS
jgi:rhodanese-related sulfurtransferase